MGQKQYAWTTRRTVDLGVGRVNHSFLVIPECPTPLLGRDILTKVGAQISFQTEETQVTNREKKPLSLSILTIRLEDEYYLFKEPEPSRIGQEWLDQFPGAWTEMVGMGLAVNQPPVVIELKASALPVTVRQYPMSKEARDGIRPHIQRLIEQGILVKCKSPWNTPLLPVKKAGTGDYRPVQDLREVNKRVQDIHPTVPNPYNLLSSLAPENTWYAVLDLKDTFFCLCLHQNSQPLFAFEWKDPYTGTTGQLTWTRLPQGFKNSPTLFDEALHQDLAFYRASNPQGRFTSFWGRQDFVDCGYPALPDMTKPFVLFVDEWSGVARGVLTQQWGPWKRPVTYLSKKLDPVSSVLPACLRVLAAVALLVKDSDKLMLGQKLTVVAPHALESVIQQPPERWMSNARMTHYQTLLLNHDHVEFAPPAILNPATLLPDLGKEVLHTCQETLAEETGTHRDLRDQPLEGPGLLTWYTDGSSYIMGGKRMAGAAVVDDDRIV
nr:uncharacterized protein LOC118973965 [Manis javanica]